MVASRIVLITVPFDQADILPDFLDWHLDLGIDLILAMDSGSTDGSRELLDSYAKTNRVVWTPLPERNIAKYAQGDELAALARDRYGADWIILCDVDEFLCTTSGDVRTILARADLDGISMLTLPRRTMTGPPLLAGQRATEALTLRIDRTVELPLEQLISGNYPVPFVFLEVGGHLAVRASALAQYGTGAHFATTTWGKSATSDELYLLHYAIRGYESLRTKVQNTKAWLADNPQLGPGWGWHWRRWISLTKRDGSKRTTTGSSCHRRTPDNWSVTDRASSTRPSLIGLPGRRSFRGGAGECRVGSIASRTPFVRFARRRDDDVHAARHAAEDCPPLGLWSRI